MQIGEDLRSVFSLFAAGPVMLSGYDANVEVNPEIFFPRNALNCSDGKYRFVLWSYNRIQV